MLVQSLYVFYPQTLFIWMIVFEALFTNRSLWIMSEMFTMFKVFWWMFIDLYFSYSALPWAYLTNEQPAGPNLGLPCQRANPWITLLWAYWTCLEPPFANEQILGLHCSGPTGPTLGLPCHRANRWITLFWACWVYVGSTFANHPILLKNWITNVITVECK